MRPSDSPVLTATAVGIDCRSGGGAVVVPAPFRLPLVVVGGIHADKRSPMGIRRALQLPRRVRADTRCRERMCAAWRRPGD